MKVAGLFGGIVLAVSTALAPAAAADPGPNEITQIKNLGVGQCLTASPEDLNTL